MSYFIKSWDNLWRKNHMRMRSWGNHWDVMNQRVGAHNMFFLENRNNNEIKQYMVQLQLSWCCFYHVLDAAACCLHLCLLCLRLIEFSQKRLIERTLLSFLPEKQIQDNLSDRFARSGNKKKKKKWAEKIQYCTTWQLTFTTEKEYITKYSFSHASSVANGETMAASRTRNISFF